MSILTVKKWLTLTMMPSMVFFTIAVGVSISHAQNVSGVLGITSDVSGAPVPDKLSETQQEVSQLQAVKDDTTLSDSQKESEEIQLRRKIISNVLDVSLSQIEDARSQVGNLSFPSSSGAWEKVKDYLNKDLDDSQQYYEDRQKELADNYYMPNDQLKSLAKSIEDEKSGVIDQSIQRVNIISALLNIPRVLSVADQRLTKVKADISKIYSQNLTENPALQNLLDHASSEISDAHSRNDEALTIAINLYTDDSSTSTKDFIKELGKKITVLWESQSTSTVASASTSTSSDSSNDNLQGSVTVVTFGNMENYLSNTIATSYTDIKSAYDIFVEMSVNVKDYLK